VSLLKKSECGLRRGGAEQTGIDVLIVTGPAIDEEDPQYPGAKKDDPG